MKSISSNEFKNASKFSGECYGTKVTIELDHSDLDIDELFDAFKSIALGLGFSETGWNQYIKETGYDLQLEDEEREVNLYRSNNNLNNEKPSFDWDNDYFDVSNKNLETSAESEEQIKLNTETKESK